ncbi:MAG: ABC transporter ATP-binding protein [Sphaerochaetaceae bacterium]|nr:ABC transporter ATP-binding protein [Sphaerochaetaceae bacterium]
MPQIVLRNITKRFTKFVAVDNLDLTINDGEFITLLGPSGCGKTTTLRMIAGLETPTEGEILIDSQVVFSATKGINVPPNKRDVGFLFQNYALWPHMTVYQNIAFGLENLKWSKSDIASRVAELLALLKIEQFSKRYPSELSGGQQQRVAIARTLAPKPKVLFLDEPLSNLDAKLRLEMRTELKRLHLDTKSTFVYVTHDQLEAMTMSTRVCLMKNGLLQQYDPPLTVYNRPINLFVADFVGNPTMNFISAKATGKGSSILLEAESFKASMTTSQAPELKDAEVVIGIRPEYVCISDEPTGKAHAVIYSNMPSGMETTIRLQLGKTMLTSVIFRGVDYPVDKKVGFSFIGSDILLFDKKSERTIASGSLQLI